MKLSIALCTYNGEPYLTSQLESYSQQERLPDEVVVCDDGSTDATCTIIGHFGRSAPFPVRLHRNSSRLGYTRNFEKAASLCQGDVILFSDQDDVWYPSKLKRVEETFGGRPSAGALFSDADLVDENLRTLNRTIWQQQRFNRRLQDFVLCGRGREVVLKANIAWAGMSVAFRSEYRKWLMPFRAIGHDNWTILLVSFLGDITIIQEPLAQWRQHQTNLTGIRMAPLDARIASAVLAEPSKTRQQKYSDKIRRWEAVRDRLLEINGVAELDYKVNMLERKIEHLRRRANMPSQRVCRLPYVLWEFLNLRYHRYSEGVLDFARDLIEKDRLS